MRETIKLMKVLSDESRLRVLNLIQERECCVCEVMQAMEISQSKASRALSALYDAGLLKMRKEGRWALYSLENVPKQAYIRDILKGIKQALADNPLAVGDSERLRKAKRVGPGCMAGQCNKEMAEEAA